MRMVIERGHELAFQRARGSHKRMVMEPIAFPDRPTVLIADDHTLVAQGLASLVESEFKVLGIVANGLELLKAAELRPPDVALIDVSMPEMTGLEAARKLLAIAPDCKVIFVSVHATPEFVREAFGIGARGYLLKKSAASELVHAMRTVLSGNSHVSLQIAGDVLSAFLHPRLRSALRPAAASAALDFRGTIGERDCAGAGHLGQNSPVSQELHHGEVKPSHYRGAHKIRHRSRDHFVNQLGPLRRMWRTHPCVPRRDSSRRMLSITTA